MRELLREFIPIKGEGHQFSYRIDTSHGNDNKKLDKGDKIEVTETQGMIFKDKVASEFVVYKVQVNKKDESVQDVYFKDDKGNIFKLTVKKETLKEIDQNTKNEIEKVQYIIVDGKENKFQIKLEIEGNQTTFTYEGKHFTIIDKNQKSEPPYEAYIVKDNNGNQYKFKFLRGSIISAKQFTNNKSDQSLLNTENPLIKDYCATNKDKYFLVQKPEPYNESQKIKIDNSSDKEKTISEEKIGIGSAILVEEEKFTVKSIQIKKNKGKESVIVSFEQGKSIQINKKYLEKNKNKAFINKTGVLIIKEQLKKDLSKTEKTKELDKQQDMPQSLFAGMDLASAWEKGLPEKLTVANDSRDKENFGLYGANEEADEVAEKNATTDELSNDKREVYVKYYQRQADEMASGLNDLIALGYLKGSPGNWVSTGKIEKESLAGGDVFKEKYAILINTCKQIDLLNNEYNTLIMKKEKYSIIDYGNKDIIPDKEDDIIVKNLKKDENTGKDGIIVRFAEEFADPDRGNDIGYLNKNDLKAVDNSLDLLMGFCTKIISEENNFKASNKLAYGVDTNENKYLFAMLKFIYPMDKELNETNVRVYLDKYRKEKGLNNDRQVINSIKRELEKKQTAVRRVEEYIALVDEISKLDEAIKNPKDHKNKVTIGSFAYGLSVVNGTTISKGQKDLLENWLNDISKVVQDKLEPEDGAVNLLFKINGRNEALVKKYCGSISGEKAAILYELAFTIFGSSYAEIEKDFGVAQNDVKIMVKNIQHDISTKIVDLGDGKKYILTRTNLQEKDPTKSKYLITYDYGNTIKTIEVKLDKNKKIIASYPSTLNDLQEFLRENKVNNLSSEINAHANNIENYRAMGHYRNMVRNANGPNKEGMIERANIATKFIQMRGMNMTKLQRDALEKYIKNGEANFSFVKNKSGKWDIQIGKGKEAVALGFAWAPEVANTLAGLSSGAEPSELKPAVIDNIYGHIKRDQMQRSADPLNFSVDYGTEIKFLYREASPHAIENAVKTGEVVDHEGRIVKVGWFFTFNLYSSNPPTLHLPDLVLGGRYDLKLSDDQHSESLFIMKDGRLEKLIGQYESIANDSKVSEDKRDQARYLLALLRKQIVVIPEDGAGLLNSTKRPVVKNK